jgi:hypothetical protein
MVAIRAVEIIKGARRSWDVRTQSRHRLLGLGMSTWSHWEPRENVCRGQRATKIPRWFRIMGPIDGIAAQ